MHIFTRICSLSLLSRTTWLTLTIILSILLTLSLLALASRLCRQSPASRTRANYAYLPLTAFEGEVPNGGGPEKCDLDCPNSLELM